MRDNHIKLYSMFRQELDKICIPVILDNEEVQEIKYEDKTVGIICGSPDYIDCVYVMPEYRRKGLAKKAVLEWYKRYRLYEIRIHIINNNKTAYKFWSSLFELRKIGGNEIDSLYEIESEKGR